MDNAPAAIIAIFLLFIILSPYMDRLFLFLQIFILIIRQYHKTSEDMILIVLHQQLPIRKRLF